MVKRRRERDRPKAGPETAFNPHKRVHLSYGEDNDPEQDVAGLDEPSPIRYPTLSASADSPLQTPPDTTSHEQAARTSTSEAGDGDDDSTTATQKPAGKPDKPSDSRKKANANPGKNESTNQKPALGSLAYQWEGSGEDEEGDMSEEDEAMAYLKAVRSERQAMPIVLRATETTSEEDIDYGLGDSRGYFVEDCYIARPVLKPVAPKKTTVSAKEAYTEVLKRRFDTMRTRLRDESLTGGQTAQTDSNKPMLRPNGGKKAYAKCVSYVQKSSPSLAQLQALDQEDTLSMLELIHKSYFKRGETLGQHTSAWLWALLARLGDVGTMNNDEVFVLRDLGKRALVIQISFNNAAMAAQLEELSRAEAAADSSDEAITPGRDGSQTAATADADKADTAGSSVTQMLDPESTLATLDMIVTIVGEFFGQRDLLDSRRSWDPEV
jgi:hypothetical protein